MQDSVQMIALKANTDLIWIEQQGHKRGELVFPPS